MKEYKLRDTALLHQGHVPFSWEEARKLIFRALNKRRARHFLAELHDHGEATCRKSVISHLAADDANWAQLHCRSVNGDYLFYCSGPQVHAMLRRANRLKEVASERRVARRRVVKIRSKPATPKHKRIVTVKHPRPRQAPSHKCTELTPQFRKSTLSWDQCIDMATAVFQVPRDSKNTARQIVARRLYNSLEKFGWQRAQYKQGGFTLQFNLQGPWLVDVSTTTVTTRLTVSCTKDNRDLTYRRLRRRLRKERYRGGYQHIMRQAA